MDPNYFNFDDVNESGQWNKDREKIAGFTYFPPQNWMSIALNTDLMYNDQDSSWKTKDSPKEWAIAYHGIRESKNKETDMTIKQKIEGIIKEGLKEGPHQDKKDDNDLRHPGQKVGCGVFHYKKPNDCEKNNVTSDKNGFMYMFMCRVKPDKIRQPETCPKMWLLNGLMMKLDLLDYCLKLRIYNKLLIIFYNICYLLKISAFIPNLPHISLSLSCCFFLIFSEKYSEFVSNFLLLFSDCSKLLFLLFFSSFLLFSII